MSNTDSFIDEVNDAVRRDQLLGYLRRYGWIAAVVMVAIIGAAAYAEYQRAQQEAKAQALGDGIIAALSLDGDTARAQSLESVAAESPQGSAMLAFLTAGAQAESAESDAAARTLQTVSDNADVPLIYRQVASFKALMLETATLDAASRRAGFEALAVPGVRLRLLAEEQLALMDIEAGQSDAAIQRFQAILDDAEATVGLQRRALQAMVALGGAPQAIETADEG